MIRNKALTENYKNNLGGRQSIWGNLKANSASEQETWSKTYKTEPFEQAKDHETELAN